MVAELVQLDKSEIFEEALATIIAFSIVTGKISQLIKIQLKTAVQKFTAHYYGRLSLLKNQ